MTQTAHDARHGRGSRTRLEPAPFTPTTTRRTPCTRTAHTGSPPSPFRSPWGWPRPRLFAQGVSPWLNAVDVLQQAFTGPLARGLSLIAIVIGGLMFAFGEGGSKKALAGIIFGLGMAMGAANFLTWLFS